jgi:hypothetical protein
MAFFNFFKPKKSVAEQETEKAMSEVAKETNQAKLIDMILNTKRPDVVDAALEKITDDSVLIGIVKRAKGSVRRRKIVKKITDQSVLEDIAKNDESSAVRYEAVLKLTNQDSIASIAINDTDLSVLGLAIDKLDNKDVLRDIINSPDESKYVYREMSQGYSESDGFSIPPGWVTKVDLRKDAEERLIALHI